jgi:hypothetical protein
MKQLAIATLFFAAALGSLWGLAYVLHILPDDSWMEIPTVITGLTFGVICWLFGFSMLEGL